MPDARGVVRLIVNPVATTTSTDLRDLIIAALAGTVDLDVALTRGKGHATELAHEACATGHDAVVVLGGDGTTNEVVQALAGSQVRLGLVPGGGANVLARALGLPIEPIAATARLLSALRTGSVRRIGLGRADDRWFTFNAGFGFDAAVVHRVERSPARKQVLRQLAFVAAALRTWQEQRDGPAPIRLLSLDGAAVAEDQQGPFVAALIGNTASYTYLGRMPLLAMPGASFDRGVDLLALDGLDPRDLVDVITGALLGGRHLGRPGVTHHHDLGALTLEASTPQPVHVDGDPLPPRHRLDVQAVPDALDVLV